MKANLLQYLPDNVHVRFGWDKGPDYFHGPSNVEYSTVVIPKIWLKHGERGRYDEWTIKETYKKKLTKMFGDHFLKTTEKIEVLEWNQLENVALMFNAAMNIGFDNILDVAKLVDPSVCKYMHNVAI